MELPISKTAEVHAKQEGTVFAKDTLNILKNWEGPATIAAITGYIASKNGIPIGNAQLSVGLGMITAGAIAEVVSFRKQYPEMNLMKFKEKMAKEWINRLQGPSNVNLVIGLVGMLNKIKGSEAAFLAGAIGTALNILPILYEHVKNLSTDEYIQR